MTENTVAIAKWLLSSGIDYKEASLITGLPTQQLRALHERQSCGAGRAFLLSELAIAIAALGARQPLNFVQVGANDGKSGDPIYRHVMKYGARALLIEPQHWLIDKLRENYRDFSGELIIENIAIGPGGSKMDLHVLKEEFWQDYQACVGRHPSQIFSPDREQVLKRIAPRLNLSPDEAERALETISVPMEPLAEVIERHGFENADVLQIDCEGWDFKVIQTLGPHRPSLINFESFNLSKEDWEDFLRWSDEENYGFIRGPMDTLAIRSFPNRLLL